MRHSGLDPESRFMDPGSEAGMTGKSVAGMTGMEGDTLIDRWYITCMIILFLFVFGLVIGSFLNVVIYRTIHGESFVKGRSKCTNCGRMISWYDNIPLISFLFLQGKCRKCHSPISWRYPAIELITGVLFVWWYAMGFAFFRLSTEPLTIIQPAFWLLVGIFLVIIIATDWLYMIIPDFAVVALAILSLAYRLYLATSGAMQWADFFLSMAVGGGLMTGLAMIWLLTRGKGMGFGDVKYALPMGWLLGWPRGVVGVFMAFLIGALVGLIMMAMGKKKMKSEIPFGPFLVLGTIIALIWGNQIFGWYISLL